MRVNRPNGGQPLHQAAACEHELFLDDHGRALADADETEKWAKVTRFANIKAE
jgi:hypothetical protein